MLDHITIDVNSLGVGAAWLVRELLGIFRGKKKMTDGLKVTALDKETVELLNFLGELSVRLIPLLKDGIQLSDAVAIVTLGLEPEFQKIAKDGISGMNNIPGEIKQWGSAEVIDVGTVLLAFVPKIIDALKAQKAA